MRVTFGFATGPSIGVRVVRSKQSDGPPTAACQRIIKDVMIHQSGQQGGGVVASFVETEIMPTATSIPARPVPPDALEGDLVPSGDPRFGLIWINPDRLSGAPCFFGSRVPVQTLFDYLEAGDTIDTFLESFPPITRDHAVAVLKLARPAAASDLETWGDQHD